MIRWDQIEPREVAPGFYARFIHSATMTFALWEVTRGAVLPMHSHPQEQVTRMEAGEFDLVLNGVTHHLKTGDLLIIPSNAPHGGKALTDCRISDSYFPRREDYLFPTGI